MRYVFVLISLLVLFSCNDKKTSTEKSSVVAESSPETPKAAYQQPPVYLDSAATEMQILEHLGKRKTEMDALLKDATSEKANELYLNYIKENDSAVYILSNRKTKLLDKYVDFMQYDEKTGTNPLVIPKEHQQEIKNIESKGVEFWYVGEGYTELRMNPDFYYKMFNGKLTPDYQRWLDFTTKEEKDLYAADAGIIVPWKEIGDRILTREKFLKDFPKSKLLKDIKGQLKIYRWDYFAGQDNTPVFPGYEETENVMDEDVAKEYQRFMKANPNSETTNILKELLKEPKQAIWRDNLNRILGERYE